MKLGLNINIGGLGSIRQPQQKQAEEKFTPRSSQGQKPQVGEKINFKELIDWATDELVHLLELKSYGLDVAKKIDWVLKFIPDFIREEVIKKAKEAGSE